MGLSIMFIHSLNALIEIVDALRVRYPCNNREVVVNQLNPHPLTEPCAAEMGAWPGVLDC